MPEITKTTITYRRAKLKRSRFKKNIFRTLAITVSTLLIVSGLGYYRYSHAVPRVHAQIKTMSYSPPVAATIDWPTKGQAAVGTTDYGLLSSSGEQKPVPTASTAKLITLLAVLESKPLRLHTSGPTISLGAKDTAIYNDYVAVQGSVVPVNQGELISQYQAFQAILLPSANNMADSLAIWAFGSLEKYSSYANQMLESYGLKHTTVGTDASGLSPTTTSTASDLVLITQKALRNPVIAEIAAQKSAVIPVAGTIYNTNPLLGSDGINGLKTGNSDEAGGVFILTGKKKLGNGQSTTIITAIMDAPDIRTAVLSGRTLYLSARKNIQSVAVVKAGDTVGSYVTPWGDKATAVATKTIAGPVWLNNSGSNNLPRFTFDAIEPPKALGDTVGHISFKRADGIKLKSEIRLSQNLPAPSFKWRMIRKN